MNNTKNKLQKIKNYDWRKLSFELLVVFLGVTAGFLLNNWQLQKKDQALEQKYLDSFLQDVNSNIIQLEQAIAEDSLWLERVKPTLLILKDGLVPEDTANTMIGHIVGISKIEIQKGTYTDIINSGNLNLLTDFNIKKQIVDYYLEISGVEFIETYFYDYFADIVMPFIFNHYNVLKVKITDPQIIKSTQFDNIITGYFSMIQQRKRAYTNLLKSSYVLQKTLTNL
jgi:hypothetical protein